MKMEITVAQANEYHSAYKALHACAKPIKNNEKGMWFWETYRYSGNVRPILTDNIWALRPIIESFNEAMIDRKKQLDEEEEDKIEEIEKQFAGDQEECERRINAFKAKQQKIMDRESDEWLKRIKPVDLEPLQRDQLNEVTNGQDPISLAILLNVGLIQEKGAAARKRNNNDDEE